MLTKAFKIMGTSFLGAALCLNLASAQTMKTPSDIKSNETAVKENNETKKAYIKKPTKYSLEERLRVENFAYPLFDKKKTGKKNYTQSRFRAKIEEELSEESKITLMLQDYRFFEREPSSDASISRNDFSIYNAILEIRNFAGIDGLFARLGRQELTLGNLRLLGNSNWNEGRVWDGMRFIYKASAGTLNLFNFDLKRHDLTPPVQIRGLYYICDKIKGMELYALKYIDRNRVNGEIAVSAINNIGINTYGFNYTKKFNKKIEANIETAIQTGDWGPEKHRASAFHAGAKYNTLSKLNYSIIIEYNEASGDKNPIDGEHGTFNNLFATNHAKYGYMDLAGWQNMKEIAVRNEFNIQKDLKAKLNYHIFKLQNSKDAWYKANKSVFDARRDASGASGNDIGSEIDLVLTKKVNANLEIEAGVSKFKAGDFVKKTTRAGGETIDPTWGYIQVLKKW